MIIFLQSIRHIAYSISIIVLSFCFTSTAAAQVAGMEADIFCGKKWYCEMTKSADGSIHPTEKSKADDYMHFLCDSSSFILIESGITLKGNWSFDEATMVITLHQKQLNTIPDSFAFHIIEYDDSHMVIMGQEGTANEETLHLYTK
jgi:hypothetical protein